MVFLKCGSMRSVELGFEGKEQIDSNHQIKRKEVDETKGNR